MMKNRKNLSKSTPYDDAFRTLMNDCEKLLIPLINEAFGKNYTGDEEIIQHPNEHFINQQDGKSNKRVTDSSFSIIDKDGNISTFIIEVQSTPDNTMIIRIFEYAVQIALDSAVLENNKMIVKIPNASIIFLRSNSSTPDEMTIEILTPNSNASFKVPVLKMKNYSLPEIFEKELYFLLPFYIFNKEKDFSSYEKDKSKLNNLKEEYNNFIERIDEATSSGKISAYYRRVILDMSKKVLEKIAKNYKKVQKGVDEIMGGRILEHEGKTILNQGIAIGEQRGIAIGEQRGIAIGEQRGIAIGEQRGKQEANFEIAKRLLEMGMTDEDIQRATLLPVDEIRLLYK